MAAIYLQFFGDFSPAELEASKFTPIRSVAVERSLQERIEPKSTSIYFRKLIKEHGFVVQKTLVMGR